MSSRDDPIRKAIAPSDAASGESENVESISAIAATPSIDNATKPMASSVRTNSCPGVSVLPDTVAIDVPAVSGWLPRNSEPTT